MSARLLTETTQLYMHATTFTFLLKYHVRPTMNYTTVMCFSN